MQFRRVTNDGAGQATGVVVVVDVIRAFTTAAYALAAGACDIVLTDTVERALALRERFSHAGLRRAGSPRPWVMGEVNGIQPEGFDLGNSPAALAGLNLAGRRLIQRTTAGTQGVVRSSVRADVVLPCSLCVARATAQRIERLAPEVVTFVLTGKRPGHEVHTGEEDAACADYVEALLRARRGEVLSPLPDREAVVRRVLDSSNGRGFLDPNRPELPAEDLAYCTAVDRFDFYLRVTRQDDLLVMTAEPSGV